MSKNRPSKNQESLAVVTEPVAFFKQEITKALSHQKVKTSESTEFYLVDLLSRFMLSENLFSVDEKGNMQQEALALLLGKALSAADAAHRQQGLRRLGDVSLYTAGFFADSLSRKVVDVDYYIGMGRTAYGHLAQMGFDAFFQTVFSELSEQFHKFVDVLAEVSTCAGSTDAKNILRQYEVWLKTRSERAEKNLKEAGIIPSSLVKPDWQ